MYRYCRAEDLPNHRFVKYARMHSNTIKKFVKSYLKAYYSSDSDVANDQEIQAWAKATAAVPLVRGFPSSFPTIDSLAALISEVVFRTSVNVAFSLVQNWTSFDYKS